MAIEPIKGFYVHDESNNQDGVAKLATDAYADSSVSTAKVADGAITEDKLGTALKTKVNQSHPNYWAQLDDDDLLEAVNIGGRIYEIIADTVEDGAISKEKLSEDLAAELENKADQDGDYDSLTAGGAKQLLSTVYVDDNEPYNFRTAGGSADIGDRMYEEVVGGSIVWNQLVQNGNFANLSYWTNVRVTATVDGGVCSVVVNSTESESYIEQTFSTIAGHKYLSFADVKTDGTAWVYRIYYNGTANSVLDANLSTSWKTCALVFSNTTSATTNRVRVYRNGTREVNDTAYIRNAVVFDLTQMFGSTIADYIYSLEQGTAGAGVAWFRNLFPKPYYEYNEGELMSVKAGSHDTVGFNALQVSEYYKGSNYNKDVGGTLDTTIGSSTLSGENPVTADIKGSWEGVLLVSEQLAQGCPYQFTTNYSAPTIANTRLTTYMIDEDFNVVERIGNYNGTNSITTSFTPSRGGLRFALAVVSTTVQKITLNDPCLHLVWDGERNGEYEPYEKHTYPLAELELRGIPKLDANNQLYYDGDTYASDGTVTRKYGIVDLGTLTWNRNGTGSPSQFFSQAIGVATDHNGKNVICSKYNGGTAYYADTDKVVCADGGRVWITDSAYSEGSAFKDAMSGVYLVYELAEPTTETADTFVNPQVVDDFGTEEYTDFAVEAGDRDVAIPVGHNSQYMNNLRAKLEMAPDSPSGDGKYIVQQNNGENAYIPYTADGRLDAIEAKLPAPPSTNGTYKLIATVTDGGVTYTWVAG